MIFRYFTFLKLELTFLHQQKNLKLKKLLACNVIKKETPAQVFSNELCQSFNSAFFCRATPVDAFRICSQLTAGIQMNRSSPPGVFLGKGALKISIKFPEEHPCRSVVSIKLLCNFIEITLQHGCSPVNWLLIFRTPFL